MCYAVVPTVHVLRHKFHQKLKVFILLAALIVFPRKVIKIGSNIKFLLCRYMFLPNHILLRSFEGPDLRRTFEESPDHLWRIPRKH